MVPMRKQHGGNVKVSGCYSKQCVGSIKKHVKSLKWQSQSSDLNPIEHLSTILDRRIRQRIHPPKNQNGLKDLLIQEWSQIGRDLTEILPDSLENRLQECLKQRGLSTRS
ncbi:unnamed protein product [Rotaria sp. Silwood1]|nr:unnamed protein product [Rotaria sp. Silwood1]CAF4826505.1 unnamed protein product [Rotaria sp. Silwood1]